MFRGLVGEWPAVAAAMIGDAALVNYFTACRTIRPVMGLTAPAEAEGRFFYNDQLTGFNFTKQEGHLEGFLTRLLELAGADAPPAMAVQSEVIPDLSPALADQNQLDWLPGVVPRIWIGNRITVAPHYDLKENLACCVAGARRFTLFPPEQIANLYAGPFELTPAGTPVSMVDCSDPDLDRYPRFSEAWAAAQQVTLNPGDVLYIPYCWWHGVESLGPLNVLINYWWSEEPKGVAGPYDALLHAMMAYRHLPAGQREVWRGMLDHYVFEANGDPAAHLQPHAKGIMSPPGPQLFARMRAMLRQALL